jgi:phosphatidylserine/phosphatidylglycerophosphate/cardiolipin synthase-like enzyme
LPRRTTQLVAVALIILVVAAALYFLWRQSSQSVIGARGPAVTYGDWYELAFTDPSYPDDRASHRGGLDQRLVNLMDRATMTLDVAIYDFDLANVADAMVRASQRNVRVRMVTDADTINNIRNEEIQTALASVKRAGIPIVDDQRPDIMHHKFSVVDGEWVQTGSWNYTDGDTYRLNNNQFIARSAELAENYTAEFEKMFVHRRFGPGKPRGVPNPRLAIGGSYVENYFAPHDRVAERLVEAIERQVMNSVYFLAFSFTHDRLGQAMMNKASAATVQGVFETTGSNTQFSEYGRMKQTGLDVYQDGNPWAMHHKVIILDERVSVFGSFNFSTNAERDNDENILIVDDEKLARAFKAEYDRVLALARRRR